MGQTGAWKRINLSALTIGFGIALLCLLWGGLYLKVQHERQQELDMATRETVSYARTFEEHTLRTLRGLDQIALILKHQVEKEGWDIDIPRLINEDRFAGQPFILLTVANAFGNVVASSQSPVSGANIQDRDYFLVHRMADNKQLYIGKPLQENVSGKTVIQLSRRINLPDGSFGGIAVVSVDPDYFAEFYKVVSLGQDSSITLLGRDGIVRIRQVGGDIQMGMDYSQRVTQKMFGDAGTYSDVGLTDGIKRIYSYRSLPEYPLIVAVGIAEAQALQGLNQRIVSYCRICGLLTLLIVLFVAALLAGMAQRKLAERSLFESELRFSNAFNFALIGVALVSPEGRWLKVNQALCRFLGYAPEELIGQDVNAAIHEEERKGSEIVRQRLLHGELESYQSEKRYVRKSGDVSWAKVSLSLVRSDQITPQYFVVQIEDISDRKQMEQNLRLHTTRLEETVELRTQDLHAANQELTAANQEMTALNEEMLAMNESLEDLNRSLSNEIRMKQLKEEDLLRRRKQHRAMTSLLTLPGEDFDTFLKTILEAAIELVGAPGGDIAKLDDSEQYFVYSHAAGINRAVSPGKIPVGRGMIGQVCQSGDLLCVDDYRRYPQRIQEPWTEGVTTLIMVPLKLNGAVKGFLTVTWRDEVHPIKPDDLEDLRQFGNLASIALDRIHASSQIAYKNQLLQKLTETTLSLVNELDLEKALQNILNQATIFMEIPHGFIQLFEPDGRRAGIKCGVGRYAPLAGSFMQFNGKGIYAEILRTGKPVIITDYQHWPDRLTSDFTKEIASAMQVPLNIEGKTIGSVGLTIFNEQLNMDWGKMAVFEQFAAVAAIAVKNALDHQQTIHQALYDALTGLPNRAHLNRHLEEEMQLARNSQASGSVLFIDLDDLKTVNDHFGHTSGDAVIITAGRDIAGAAGERAFVARVGGDEFVVILPGTDDLADIALISDRLIDAIPQEYEIKGQKIHMSASVGVARYPRDGSVAEEILKNADAAMYAAKAAGKNCWRVYDAAMLKEPYEQMLLTNSLRHALERGEFHLHYQPMIAMQSKAVVGFEALLRWNGQEHGMVAPSRFIPLAERSGLILPIGEWVFAEACRFAGVLATMGKKSLHVSVNVSPRQLATADFVSRMRRTVEMAGIEPSQLELEVTENVLIESLEDSTRKLAELSALGIRLALDDFGTGFSSLTYLRNLPVGTLKIDKSFIARMFEDSTQEEFIRSMIDMAHVLKLKVVAEGVETESQFDKLAALGCDYAQGYWFSKPVSQDSALRFL